MADEATLLLHFDVEEGAELEDAGDAVLLRLSSLQGVKEAETSPEQPRLGGAEIAAGITAAVTIVAGSRQLVEELRKLIASIKGLVDDVKTLKGATVEVGAERISLADLTDEHLERLGGSRGAAAP
jgi:hypothetical protein